MIGRFGPFALRIVFVGLAHSLLLGWIVWDRVTLLTSGREVRLEVVPVDPRDIFRGDFVILNYKISRLVPASLEGDKTFARNDIIHVGLKKTEAGPWQPISVHSSPPGVSGGVVFIRGRVTRVRQRRPRTIGQDGETEACNEGCQTLFVSYGIESYFVPEGTGRELEKMRNDSKIEALTRISDAGEAAIAGLIVDGEPRYVEPLY